jgi:hypothetical protein
MVWTVFCSAGGYGKNGCEHCLFRHVRSETKVSAGGDPIEGTYSIGSTPEARAPGGTSEPQLSRHHEAETARLAGEAGESSRHLKRTRLRIVGSESRPRLYDSKPLTTNAISQDTMKKTARTFGAVRAAPPSSERKVGLTPPRLSKPSKRKPRLSNTPPSPT